MNDLLDKGGQSAAELFDEPLANEMVYLCYTSGSTGKPKGVEVRFFVLSGDVVSHSDFRRSRRTRTLFRFASGPDQRSLLFRRERA